MRASFYFARFGLLICCLISINLLSNCKPRLIPRTSVPATRQNEKIVKFLEQYKNAIEKRSVEGIMELVAKDFSDNRGSEDPALHMDYLRLKEELEKSLPRIQDARVGMHIQHIDKINKNLYEVVFFFNKNLLLEVPSGEKWVAIKDVARVVIREVHGKNSPYNFEIVQGI